jgi:hypothetical protein
MEKKMGNKSELSKCSILDLWTEIGKRLNLQYGKVQMSYHNGKPSAYANVDLKIKTEVENNILFVE